MVDKFKIGELVKVGKLKTIYVIQEIVLHGMKEGKSVCGCCKGELYNFYRVNDRLWLNEEVLEKLD